MNKNVVAELNHQINSPLAAIRSVLYLVSVRTSDEEIHRYLQIAEEEVVQIAEFLQLARREEESALRHEIPIARRKAA